MSIEKYYRKEAWEHYQKSSLETRIADDVSFLRPLLVLPIVLLVLIVTVSYISIKIPMRRDITLSCDLGESYFAFKEDKVRHLTVFKNDVALSFDVNLIGQTKDGKKFLYKYESKENSNLCTHGEHISAIVLKD